MSEQDENIKKAKQATSYAMMQDKAREYQEKILSLRNKDYQSKYKGLSIKMKGDYQLTEVKIDQNFYETAGKQEIEQAILVAFSNLHRAIEDEQKELQDQMTSDIQRMQMESMADNNNGNN